MRFLPAGEIGRRFLPPTEESTWARKVVGTWTKGDAAHVDGGEEAGDVADDAAAEKR